MATFLLVSSAVHALQLGVLFSLCVALYVSWLALVFVFVLVFLVCLLGPLSGLFVFCVALAVPCIGPLFFGAPIGPLVRFLLLLIVFEWLLGSWPSCCRLFCFGLWFVFLVCLMWCCLRLFFYSHTLEP